MVYTSRFKDRILDARLRKTSLRQQNSGKDGA